MKRTSFLLIFVLLLFACAGNMMYEKKLDTYIGQTEQSLIEQWGRPTGQKILSDGTKVLTYTQTSEYYVPTEYFYDQPGWGPVNLVYDPFFGEYEFAPVSQIVDTEVEGICQTSFVVKNDVVISYSFRGNACS